MHENAATMVIEKRIDVWNHTLQSLIITVIMYSNYVLKYLIICMYGCYFLTTFLLNQSAHSNAWV